MSFLTRSRIWGGNGALGSSGGGSGGSDAFNGNRAITRDTPGIDGVTAGGTTVVAFLSNLFFPAVAPAATISVDNPVREIGQSPEYTLTWAVTEETNPITGINVDGTAITPTGNNQSGTQSGSFANAYGSYEKDMSVTDGSLTGDASCTVQYLPRMFWGTVASQAAPSDADILALANSELTDSIDLSLSNFGGGATYLMFAFPSSFGTPSFVINGLANTAFTKVRSGSNFVNGEGATIVMDVWVSNNLYNSPLASIILS